MAYCIGVVDTSSSERDVRGYKYAKYFCPVCKEESQYTITPNFQFRERKCKHCGAMGKEDKLNSLKREREEIIRRIAEFNTHLIEIDTEIQELETNNEIEKITK